MKVFWLVTSCSPAGTLWCLWTCCFHLQGSSVQGEKSVWLNKQVSRRWSLPRCPNMINHHCWKPQNLLQAWNYFHLIRNCVICTQHTHKKILSLCSWHHAMETYEGRDMQSKNFSLQY
jgi:hypothetical protein